MCGSSGGGRDNRECFSPPGALCEEERGEVCGRGEGGRGEDVRGVEMEEVRLVFFVRGFGFGTTVTGVLGFWAGRGGREGGREGEEEGREGGRERGREWKEEGRGWEGGREGREGGGKEGKEKK